jgi:hypothetical protein
MEVRWFAVKEQGDRRFYVWVGVSGLMWVVIAKVPQVPQVLEEMWASAW